MKNINWKKILIVSLEIIAGLVFLFALGYVIFTGVVA